MSRLEMTIYRASGEQRTITGRVEALEELESHE
jgi:hypothetical protein